MGSTRRTPSDLSLEALLSTAAPGAPVSGELLCYLRPCGVVGALAEMPLTEILQNMDFGKRSVRVDVWQEGAEGTVHVHDGQIVHAAAATRAGTTSGEAAVLELCRRAEGFFRIHYVREDVDRSVHRPTTFVLLEALRVLDEANAERGERPAAVDLGPDLWSEPSREAIRPDPSADDIVLPPDPHEPPIGGVDVDVGVDLGVDADTGSLQARLEYPRYRVGAAINVFVDERVTSMFLEDIGRGGAFLRTDRPLTRDAVVTLRLPSQDGAVEVPARIVHVLDPNDAASLARDPGIGVRFDELSADVATRLGAFVDQLGGQPAVGDARASNPRDRLLALVAESELLVAAGDLESAKTVLSRAQGLAPGDDDVRRKLHNVNESIDAAQANAFLEKAMRGGPEAVELARRATQLRPVRDVLLRSLAVFARGGAHDEIADVAEQLLELDPDDEGALRTLLDANVAMQRWPVAVRAAESLLRLRPQDEQLRVTLENVVAQARRPS